MKTCSYLFVYILLGFFTHSVYAHQLAPLLFKVSQIEEKEFLLSWKESELKPKGIEVAPVLPDDCKKLSEPVIVHKDKAYIYEWQVHCDDALLGREILFQGLKKAKNNVMVVYSDLQGRSISQLVTSQSGRFVVPIKESAGDLIQRNILSGIEHLVFGWDHVLFVIGLFGLLSMQLRVLFWAITAFTVGHSFTLVLASMGYIPFNPQWIEIFIAITIAMLAVELFRPEGYEGKWTLRNNAYLLTFVFGLIHGCGFANVLVDALSSEANILLPLLTFNLGIEVGQILILMFMSIIFYLLRKLKLEMIYVYRSLAYLLGTMSTYWLLARITAF